MKQLKSSLRELRELFERTITAKDIAEPFASFDSESSTHHVRNFMKSNDFDIIGVRKDGIIAGYAWMPELSDNKLGSYLIRFDDKDLLSEKAPMIEIFKKLRDSTKTTLFVLVFGEVAGIITRGDLQKIPVRMWLFGLISLIEMHLLRIIRSYYPEEKWRFLISKNRLDMAQKILEDRQYENIAIDLADCLQFSDKYFILLKNKDYLERIGFTAVNPARRLFSRLEKLRNRLAHAQDIITGNWPDIVDLINKTEELLNNLEQIAI